MPNKENIEHTKFPKGVSGNPKGRPPKTITEYLREYGSATKIDATVKITKSDGKEYTKVIKLESATTINELVGLTLIQAALAGDLGSQKELLDRTEGKAKQQLEIESTSNDKVTIIWQ